MYQDPIHWKKVHETDFGKKFFKSEQGVRHYIRRHGPELIECGALIALHNTHHIFIEPFADYVVAQAREDARQMARLA